MSISSSRLVLINNRGSTMTSIGGTILKRSLMCCSSDAIFATAPQQPKLFPMTPPLGFQRHAATTATTQRLISSATIAPSTNKNSKKVIATGPDGTKYSIPVQYPLGKYRLSKYAPKLAPSIVQSRIRQLKVTEGKLKDIRHSPWRLNLLCQFVSKSPGILTVEDALLQLQFNEKSKATLVSNLVQGTASNALTQHGLLPSQLEIAECFATHGKHLKRVAIMGRGRTGVKHHRFAHVRLVLREIDFPLKILTAPSPRLRQHWIDKMHLAEAQHESTVTDAQELENLERQVKEMQLKQQQEQDKEKEKP